VILRSWSAHLDPKNVAHYLEHLDHALKPALGALPGFQGIVVLERSVDDAGPAISEVVVQTRWDSLEAVRAFAGDDVGHAVVEPAAAALFVDYDRRVTHYEIVG
jgi:heme-degrading monooxygenase HmoA